MKIALCGSAPSSMRKAPFGDTSWQIWGCSPGLYPFATRVDAWFEVHRWEPPVIGRPDQQVPWFSPEYVMWLQMLKCPVWMLEQQPMVPTSLALPWQELSKKYGTFFFNSSLSWMAAMAIEAILVNRELVAAGDARGIPGEDSLGFWGVDMAADDEIYTQQKAGCQFFATLAASMGIKIVTPPESDLLIPRPMYGVWENSPRHIKLLTRENEFKARKAAAEAQLASAQANLHYINGALDDLKYHLNTWIHEGEIHGPQFETMPFLRPVVHSADKVAAATAACGSGSGDLNTAAVTEDLIEHRHRILTGTDLPAGVTKANPNQPTNAKRLIRVPLTAASMHRPAPRKTKAKPKRR